MKKNSLIDKIVLWYSLFVPVAVVIVLILLIVGVFPPFFKEETRNLFNAISQISVCGIGFVCFIYYVLSLWIEHVEKNGKSLLRLKNFILNLAIILLLVLIGVTIISVNVHILAWTYALILAIFFVLRSIQSETSGEI